MNVTNSTEKLWMEKYRPSTIDDVILPKDIKDVFKGFVTNNEMPNLILCSRKGGTGKTSTAKALCNDLGYDALVINASLEGNIDLLRNKLTTFVTSVSLTGNKKCVILDESDYLNSNSTQPALRNFMESFSKNCRFILTCNFVNRLLDPIQSRCTVIDFDAKMSHDVKKDLMAQALRRLIFILKNEHIEFDPKAVTTLLINHFPDIRRCINELQRYSSTGKIDSGILINMEHDNYSKLVQYLRDRKFNEMRDWVAANSDISDEKLFAWFYDNATTIMEPQSIPQLVLTTADYQYKAAFVADKQINIAAYLTELMSNCVFLG